jgi:hypothetical protein
VYRARQVNAAWLCQTFEPHCNINAVAKNVITIDNNVTDIDTDAKINSSVGRNIAISLCHRFLNIDGACDRVDST